MDLFQTADFYWKIFEEKISHWFGSSVVMSCPVELIDPDEMQGSLLITKKGQKWLLHYNVWAKNCITREFELYIISYLFACADKGPLNAEAKEKARWLAANTNDEEVLSLLNDLFLNQKEE